MRCFIIFDDQNYIMSVKTASDGVYELPDDVDFNYLNCYYLSEDEFLFDEEKKQRIIETDDKKNEIESLQKKLDETDHIFVQYIEDVIALDNPLTWISDVIKLNVSYLKQYKDIIKQRAEWRARIKELENEL